MPAAPRRLRALFTATIFLGSFLLFLIQPMFARLVLPELGGAPSVWNSALLFYQAALLGGYLWAHALARLAPATQLALHVALFVAAALTLPISVAGVPEAWRAASPAVWLIGLFALSIGPVFVAVAAQAPLMQSWFSRTGQPPWFLYAASNAGSLLALITYPLAFEPLMGLRLHTAIWSGGYLALAAAMLACGLATRRLAPPPAAESAPPPSWAQRGRWALLAAVPSGLLLSTTAFLTTDVMAMPLLWVVPLALYLVTFIMAFSGAGAILDPARFAPLLLITLGAPIFLVEGLAAFAVAGAGLALFFYVALALHSELAHTAPPPARLTEFYLWIAVGGVVGGLLPALIAPTAFDWTWEHPVLLVAAALLLPPKPLTSGLGRLWNGPARPALLWAMPVLAAGLAWWAGDRIEAGADVRAAAPAVAFVALAAVLAIGRPPRFAFHFALLLAALGGIAGARLSATEGARERSFFGVYAVEDDAPRGVRQLMHGTTLHGAQAGPGRDRLRPTTYYSPTSGVGRAMEALPDRARVGVVGLGTGTLACYAQPGERWTFFELDPLVVDVARARFGYLGGCAPDAAIVLGDARLKLAEGPAAAFDALAVDAFSSDAIPTHLLTREAFGVYLAALAPDGVLLVHTSNRFIELEPVVAANARMLGLSARILVDRRPEKQPRGRMDSSSDWILLARSDARLAAALAAMPPGGWRKLNEPAGFRPWTDDYASLLPVLK